MQYVTNLDKKIFEDIDLNILFSIIERVRGRLAQLVERLPYKEDVGSSSLSTPTIILKEPLRLFFSAQSEF